MSRILKSNCSIPWNKRRLRKNTTRVYGAANDFLKITLQNLSIKQAPKINYFNHNGNINDHVNGDDNNKTTIIAMIIIIIKK